jgi:hypothetical protein
MQQAFARLAPLLSERENQGQVRRCHGDLHLRNIVLIEDRPVLFDAIEFDEAIATCDVLYDLAFLLMDLWTRELESHANLLLNRYLWICDDVERQLKALSLLPLFLSLRSAIRAKVTVLQPGSGNYHAVEARRHFEAACSLLAPRRLDLVAVGGMSGTGKSSLAAALSGSIGRAPGAVHCAATLNASGSLMSTNSTACRARPIARTLRHGLINVSAIWLQRRLMLARASSSTPCI